MASMVYDMNNIWYYEHFVVVVVVVVVVVAVAVVVAVLYKY